MIAERIKTLRETNNLTQSALAKKLNVTRSSVNAWEMGISVPSTSLIVDIARRCNVATEFVLGIDSRSTLDLAGLNDREVMLVYELVEYFKSTK